MLRFLFATIKYLLMLGITGLFLGVLITAATFYVINPELPDINNQEKYQLDSPLQIYSKNNKLMAEFGVMKREPLVFSDIPNPMINAIVAAEDSHFFIHPGVDFIGLTRAFVHLLRTGTKGQGGSTITMQVARNFFLNNEKTYIRKIKEIFLSLKLERQFNKQQILELYLNKIYLGHRAYGIGAAANIYYGKKINELSLDQFAMIAGLPKAPSSYNPITNRKRATIRRNYVLKRMLELNFIRQREYQENINKRDNAHLHQPEIELNAPYVAEMARAWLNKHKGKTLSSELGDFIIGDDIYSGGYKVYTTIDSELQQHATIALREALQEYERRHGYRGVHEHIELADDLNNTNQVITDIPEHLSQKLLAHIDDVGQVGDLMSGIVLNIHNQNQEQSAQVLILHHEDEKRKLHGEIIDLGWNEVKWAATYISPRKKGPAPTTMEQIFKPGDLIWLQKSAENKFQLAQIPQVSGALISINPQNGELIALSGGFDFYQSKFNRAIQAERQPGSNFKPFIYSAALNKGYTPATLINDAPVVFNDRQLEDAWRPANYSGKFFGPTRMRQALYKSRNMVSVRILKDIGVNYALNYAQNFGFDKTKLPHNLSLALGSASVTPLQIVRGYASFANGGYLITPWFIDRIEDQKGNVIYQNQPQQACSDYYPQTKCPEDPKFQAPRTLESDNAYLMTSMLKDVINRGTGVKAKVLKRHDLAGKTGTTNEQVDAWFTGYNRNIVTSAWVGFDTPESLGRYETGGKAALPMWIKFMRQALKNIPEYNIPQPENIVQVKIDTNTSELASEQSQSIMFEVFRKGNEPKNRSTITPSSGNTPTLNELNEELF